MEGVGIIVGAVVAVCGWLANGVLARRATSRQRRIEYLLSAYRRLEAASNRIMTTDHELAIESAVSDIQLLGTPQQVALADAFAREFASDGRADTARLLEDLRASLRAELLLERLPPRRIWLRITREGQWTEEKAFVEARVTAPPPGGLPPSESANAHVDQLLGHDPAAAVVQSYVLIEHALRSVVADHEGVEAMTGARLARAAATAARISSATAEAVEGLGVMRNLALHGQRKVTAHEAQEFVAMVDAVLFALKRETRERGFPMGE